MRIDRLDLIRFGKFTGRSLDFPLAERDFHVVVGPNEAGKSTVRAAILDLLYGIPKNTSHAFIHAMPELRLGGAISHDGALFEFGRVKGNKQTLRCPADKVLADGALDAFLGATDRDFFSQMFGLNHERLVEGGDSILSASDDLGQVLFQSAAGIGNLGAVREALEAEADKLWTKRKSGERAYYLALADLETAKAALKNATVRGKDWSECQQKLAALDAELAQARTDHLAVRARRNLLERVRRVKPQMDALADIAAALAAHAAAPDLPESAAATLAASQRDIAAAEAGIAHAGPSLGAAKEAVAAIRVDERMRELGTEINELAETRLALRAHPANIARLQAEVEAQWAVALGVAAQLEWDASREEVLRARVPGQAVHAELVRLIRGHAALQQQVTTAERAQQAKLGELNRARAAMAALPAADVSAGLKFALGQVQKLGDFDAARVQRQQQAEQKEAAAQVAFEALGAWRRDEAALRAMSAPSPDVVGAFAKDQLADEAEARAAGARVRLLDGQIGQLELDIAQFRATHQPVSREQVRQARGERDATWTSFKLDGAALLARALEYEKLVEGADLLADSRHDKVQQGSELQSKQQQQQRLVLERAAAAADVARLADAAEERAARWAGFARECGLPELPFQAAAGWLDARERALDAAQALADARRALASHAALCEAGREALARELGIESASASADEALAVLAMRADAQVSAMTEASGQRRTLARQIDDAETALQSLDEARAGAQLDFDDWRQAWHNTLAQADLYPHTEPAMVEAVLASVKKIDDCLAAMRKLRTEHIDVMQAELGTQAARARALAERIAPDLADAPADDIAIELMVRLGAANAAHAELTRQRETIAALGARLEQEIARRDQAQASLAPLFERAKARDTAELADAIERSDAVRRLRLDAAGFERLIRDGGDGLAVAQLRAEAEGIDMAALKSELDALTGQDAQLVETLSELAVRRQAAALALGLIGGAADAARAEGQRQEALARMAETVERYLKVYVGARLLKWSIDQYREIKQGPMLQLAGRIFASLTQGSFERLTVDFDSVPLKLQGRRPNGSTVDIEGLSEGTRDQLYLSLRLAALDMHLGQAHVLPFIADDLFINFDDRRSVAGLRALGELSRKTQVVFLTHNDHILPMVAEVFGKDVNIVRL
ncbi:MAG: hypothetical protein JWR65_5042 [Massilia sp.]|nr:hypothetical protein [Massilia sp.]